MARISDTDVVIANAFTTHFIAPSSGSPVPRDASDDILTSTIYVLNPVHILPFKSQSTVISPSDPYYSIVELAVLTGSANSWYAITVPAEAIPLADGVGAGRFYFTIGVTVISQSFFIQPLNYLYNILQVATAAQSAAALAELYAHQNKQVIRGNFVYDIVAQTITYDDPDGILPPFVVDLTLTSGWGVTGRNS